MGCSYFSCLVCCVIFLIFRLEIFQSCEQNFTKFIVWKIFLLFAYYVYVAIFFKNYFISEKDYNLHFFELICFLK